MEKISKMKIFYYVLIAFGFILPISSVVLSQIPKAMSIVLAQLFSAIFKEKNAATFSMLTLFSIIVAILLIAHLGIFLAVNINKNKKSVRYYQIVTLVYSLSGIIFFSQQSTDMLFVIIVYYLFLAISAMFIQKT